MGGARRIYAHVSLQKWRKAPGKLALDCVEGVIEPIEPHGPDSTTGYFDAHTRYRQLATRARLLGGDLDERCQVLDPECPLLPPEQTNLFEQLGVIGK